MLHRRLVVGVAGGVLGVLCVCGVAAAQNGRVSGIVREEGGQPLKGATVTADNPSIGQSFTSTTDDKGRFYITTELGVQVFDATGRLAGIIAKPPGVKSIVSAEFAGEEHRWLFVAGGDKVPRKGGPGVTYSDLLVVNKTDLAALVGADLQVMADDAAAARGGRPTVLQSLSQNPAATEVLAWVRAQLREVADR